MAAKLNIDGILFNNVQPAAKTTGAILAHSPYKDLNGNPINKFYNGYIQTPTPFINAFDINWNGAVIKKDEETNLTISSSADLLKQLEIIYQKFGDYAPKSVEESIEAFSSQLENITENIEEIVENAQTQSDWLETDSESSAFILNKPFIPTSIYNLSDWNDFATQDWINNRLRRFNSAYDIYVEQQQNIGQTPLSEEAWIDSLHGLDGTNGLSAYELAVRDGLTNLSEVEWIKSLKAKDGWTAYEIAVNNGFTGTEQEWLASIKGEQGDRGKSNYDIYKELTEQAGEEVLSESDWLTTLKGEKGNKGDQGEPGKDGNSVQIIASFDTIDQLREEVEGKYYTLGSAYLVDGYLYVYNDAGTTFEEQWKNVGEIKGPQGDPGQQGERGKSNYDIYVELKELAGEIPLSEADWLESLKGKQGKSNYDIYKELKELAGEEPLSEEEWLDSLKVNTQYIAGNGISISEDNVISLATAGIWATINN